MLKLNSDGIEITLNIQKYQKPGEGKRKEGNESEFDAWAETTLTLKSGEWLNYNYITNREILLCCEIDSIARNFEALISGKLTEKTPLIMIEPDIEFILYPRKLINNQGAQRELVNSYAELIVNFWDNGVLTGNYLTITLDKANMEKIIKYIKEIQA